MPRQGITKEEVFKAANELAKEERTVTVTNIRHKLGDTGSLTTISTYLKEWKDGTKAAPSELPEIPDSIERSMKDALKTIWKAATDYAQQEIDQSRKALEQQKVEILSEKEEALQIADNMDSELQNAKLEVARYKKMVDDLNLKKQQIDTELKNKDEQLKKAETDLKGYQETKNELFKSTERCKIYEDKFNEEKERSSKAIDRLEADLREARTELKEEKKRSSETIDRLESELKEMTLKQKEADTKLQLTQEQVKSEKDNRQKIEERLLTLFEEPKKEEPGPKKDEPKGELKKDEPKKDEPKKDEPKKDELKKDELKKEEPKKVKEEPKKGKKG